MRAVRPECFADYLVQSGWIKREEVPGKGSFWLYTDEEGNDFEIQLPTNPELADFEIRMSEAIRTLAIVENRDSRQSYDALLAKQLADASS